MYEQYLAGYSNALEAFSDEFNWRWTAQLQAGRIAAFLERSRAALDAAAPGLAPMIAGGLAALPSEPRAAFEWMWSPEPSLLPLAQEPSGPLAEVGRGAALALHLAAQGVSGSWRAAFDPPIGLRFDRWWIAHVTGAELDACGTRVSLSLTTADGVRERLAWRREDEEWTIVEGDRPPCPAIEWHGAKIAIMPLLRGQQACDADVIPVDVAMVDSVRAGLDLIEATSPAYVEWVARLMRIIVPWRPTPGMFRNASNPNCCSCVMMTIHPDAPRIAETFVHEVSHQYFDLLECFTPLVNGQDTRQYWSPPRRENRPVRAILIAHHAFVNCLAYYQLQIARGLRPPSDFGRTFDELVEWQKELEVHLSASDGLTAVGESVWRRLQGRVALLDLAMAA